MTTAHGTRKVLTFVIGNVKKLEEVTAIVGSFCEVQRHDIDLPELQGDSNEVALAKGKAAAELIKTPLIIEDTCLCFNALDGLPGPYIKDFLKALKPEGLYTLLSGFEDKSAYALFTVITLILCIDVGGKKIVERSDPTLIFVYLLLYAACTVWYPFAVSAFFRNAHSCDDGHSGCFSKLFDLSKKVDDSLAVGKKWSRSKTRPYKHEQLEREFLNHQYQYSCDWTELFQRVVRDGDDPNTIKKGIEAVCAEISTRNIDLCISDKNPEYFKFAEQYCALKKLKSSGDSYDVAQA